MENFVITIARQYGSGGRTVGKMLAEKLGVSFYDKQIIQMASDESGIDVKLFGQVEEGSSVKASLFNKTGLYKGDLIAPDQKGLFLMRIFLIIRRRLQRIWQRRNPV